MRAICESVHATVNFEPTTYSQMLSASIANEKSEVLDALLAKAEIALQAVPAAEEAEEPQGADMDTA